MSINHYYIFISCYQSISFPLNMIFSWNLWLQLDSSLVGFQRSMCSVFVLVYTTVKCWEYDLPVALILVDPNPTPE